MQYCPVANYHYVHNLWHSVRGDSEQFLCFSYFLKMEAFRSELHVNRALIVHTTLYNSALTQKYKFSFSPFTQTIHWLSGHQVIL